MPSHAHGPQGCYTGAMRVTILQWNIWYKEDIRNIASFLQSQHADIICLQELSINSRLQTVQDTPAYIAQQLGYNYYCKELPIESTDGSKIMLANGIFSRFPLSEQSFAWINQPKGEGGYGDEFRAYVETGVDLGGQTLYVGTTHMSYTHRFQPTPSKKEESDQLLERLRARGSKFIFAGDLNALPDSYTIKSVKRFLQDAGPAYDEKTWTTKPFSYQGFEETELRWRLDYMFASKDLQVLSSEVLQTDYSDHLPLLTSFSV